MNRHRFTLAEVLVTVMIVAVLVPVTMRALSLDWQLDQQAAQRQQAARLADMKLRELLVTQGWLDAEKSAEFGGDYPGYTWELITDEWTTGDITLQQLDLTVRGPGGDRAAVTLTALTPYPEAE